MQPPGAGSSKTSAGSEGSWPPHSNLSADLDKDGKSPSGSLARSGKKNGRLHKADGLPPSIRCSMTTAMQKYPDGLVQWSSNNQENMKDSCPTAKGPSNSFNTKCGGTEAYP